MMENVRNRLKREIIKKHDYRKNIKQQSKLIVNGIRKLYENYDSYNLKRNGVPLDKPICVGFAIPELSKLHMYET